jgi:hypothetical protein
MGCSAVEGMVQGGQKGCETSPRQQLDTGSFYEQRRKLRADGARTASNRAQRTKEQGGAALWAGGVAPVTTTKRLSEV